MGIKRPYRIVGHYDHPVNDPHGDPLDFVFTVPTEFVARTRAAEIVRRGGKAMITHRDTGEVIPPWPRVTEEEGDWELRRPASKYHPEPLSWLGEK